MFYTWRAEPVGEPGGSIGLSQAGFVTAPNAWASGGEEDATPATPVSSLYEL